MEEVVGISKVGKTENIVKKVGLTQIELQLS